MNIVIRLVKCTHDEFMCQVNLKFKSNWSTNILYGFINGSWVYVSFFLLKGDSYVKFQKLFHCDSNCCASDAHNLETFQIFVSAFVMLKLSCLSRHSPRCGWKIWRYQLNRRVWLQVLYRRRLSESCASETLIQMLIL